MYQELASLLDNSLLLRSITFFLSFVALSLTYYFARKNKSPYKELPKTLTFSGLTRRIAASTIDSLIISIFVFVIAFVFTFLFIMGNVYLNIDPIILEIIENLSNFIIFILAVLFLPIQQASKHQATFGMRLFGIKIYNADLKKANFWILLGRHLSMGVLFTLTLGISGLMIIWTKRKQGLHDKVARTIVCRQW